MSVFRIINSIRFFKLYAPSVKNHARKVLGVNVRGGNTDFSLSEKKEIKKGIDKMCLDLKAAVDNPELRKEGVS